MEQTFSGLLIQLLTASGKTIKDLYDDLVRSGSSISYQSLSSYKRYMTVPVFERAKTILTVLHYNSLSDQELVDILEFSRNELRRLKEENRADVRQGVRLIPSKFDPSLSADELDIMITRRISELSIGQNFNDYVTYLIRNDLIQSGYIKQK